MADITEKLQRPFSLLEAGVLTREQIEEQRDTPLLQARSGSAPPCPWGRPGPGVTAALLLVSLVACGPEPTPAELAWVDVEPDLCIARTFTASSSNLELALDVIEELGVTSMRSTITWRQVEPSPGEFDFTNYEEVIDTWLGMGVEPLSLLAYGNPWATSVPDADQFYPPDDPADFGNYAGETAAWFAGRVRRYEVWNEQNAGYRFWKPELSGDPVAYGDLFAAAADAVHAADPEAEVYIGGTFFHGQFIIGAEEFLAAMPQAAWDAADGVAFHPYTFYPPSVPPEYAGESETSQDGGEVPLVDMIARLRQVTADAGRPDLPLVVTEFGWPRWGGVDAQEQADWAERSVLLGLGQGVSTWCGYTIFDGDTNGAEDRFGMALPDGTLTPYGERMRDLGERLKGVTAAAPIPDLPAGQHGVVLRGADSVERRITWGHGVGETPVWE
ncbi:MAG: hypothetical protein QF464_17055 [Myxococcota bacterium]|nr:hypothetical protein [Myxococcota bacterium]